VRSGGKGEPWRRVVGVVGDVYQYGLDSRKTLQIYLPYRQNRIPEITLLVGAAGDPMALVPAVRKVLNAADREMPLGEVTTMERVLDDSMARRRFPMTLAAALGACAVLLAAIGIYGVTAYAMARRTSEFGVRMALGARPADVVLLVLRHNCGLLAAGAVLGAIPALLVARMMSGMLFAIVPADPAAFAGAVLVLLAGALAASWLPVRRALRLDPVRALRAE